MEEIIEKNTNEDQPIIEFKNVSKVYTLYKDSKQQFIALFVKSKKFKKHKALDGVNFKINNT